MKDEMFSFIEHEEEAEEITEDFVIKQLTKLLSHAFNLVRGFDLDFEEIIKPLTEDIELAKATKQEKLFSAIVGEHGDSSKFVSFLPSELDNEDKTAVMSALIFSLDAEFSKLEKQIIDAGGKPPRNVFAELKAVLLRSSCPSPSDTIH